MLKVDGAILVGKDELAGDRLQWFVDDHVALVVVVMLKVDGAVLFVKLKVGLVEPLDRAVRLSDEDGEEEVCSSHDLSLDVGDAVQTEVVRSVEVSCEGDVSKVSRCPDVLILLGSLLGTASTDDVVLQLGLGADNVWGLAQLAVTVPPPAASLLQVAEVWIDIAITATHWRQWLPLAVGGTNLLLRADL